MTVFGCQRVPPCYEQAHSECPNSALIHPLTLFKPNQKILIEAKQGKDFYQVSNQNDFIRNEVIGTNDLFHHSAHLNLFAELIKASVTF